MRPISIPFFRIFYSSTYTVLLLILFVLLAATPGDHIYQTISNSKIGNVFVVAGVYIVTALIALFIYASRLYTNRVALAAIPRWYLPIEKGEVSNGVFKLITKNRQRSALVAWDTRPRGLTSELEYRKQTHPQHRNEDRPHKSAAEAALRASVDTQRSTRTPQTSKPHHHQVDATSPPTIVPVNPDNPPWGLLSHLGWSSPSSPDLPNLYFATVIAELPHLLEANAVSLAPPDPSFSFIEQTQHGPSQNSVQEIEIPRDADVVSALQRRPKAGLREYLSRLAELGAASDVDAVARFVSLYEAARFSAQAVLEAEFRELMAAFAELLGGFVALDDRTVQQLRRDAHGDDVGEKGVLGAGHGASLLEREPSVHSSLGSTGSVAHYGLDNW